MPDDPAGARSDRRAAHAKANLALAVTGRRPDGYHELRSVVVRLALHDDLEAELTQGADDSLVVEGDPDCTIDDNLVRRAAELVRAAGDRPLSGLAFRLRKPIPMAAGLGGGSSDAAAALDLAAAVWDIDLDPDERLRAASELGADVPFFAGGHDAALVEGVGERLRGLSAPNPPAGVLLVTPAARLSTARVFATWDADRGASAGAAGGPAGERIVDGLVERLAAGLSGEELAALAHELHDANDLWPAATRLMPALAALRDDLEASLGRPLLMTGSGSTLLGLYPSLGAAEEAAIDLSGLASLTGARVTATATMGEGAT
jgi:4-diphosphocytidyl-2-C-methyl-D-erythritol kinase